MKTPRTTVPPALSSSADRGSAGPPIRIAVDNDFPVVIAGVEALLSQYPDRVCVVDAADTVNAPHVVLYDSFGATTSIEAYVERVAGPKVVVYSAVVDPAAVLEALRVGAAGYVYKGLSGDDLVSALVDVHRSVKPVIAMDRTVGADLAPRRWPGENVRLTEREAEVLALVCQGLSNKDIAATLFLSVNSVKTYVRLAYRKINVKTRTNAMLWGLAHGFASQGRSRLPGSSHS